MINKCLWHEPEKYQRPSPEPPEKEKQNKKVSAKQCS